MISQAHDCRNCRAILQLVLRLHVNKCSPATILMPSKCLLLAQRSLAICRQQTKAITGWRTVNTASSDRPQFPGSRSQWTEKLEFLKCDAGEGIPVYRVMGRDGKVIDASQDPQLGEEKIKQIYQGAK